MNVLVLGDYCQDIFVTGKVERLCPEAPCPVLLPQSTSYNDGMAGNVYMNVKSLAPTASVHFFSQPDIIRKTRYVDATSGYILLRVDENDEVKNPTSLAQLLRQFDIDGVANVQFDIILISDYNKGYLTKEAIQDITRHFSSKGSLVFLDTKKLLGDWSKDIDFVKINEKEYSEQLKHNQSCWQFCKNLIVTMGARGSRDAIFGPHVLSDEVEVMDVSGAGDTYFAAFALRYAQYKDKIDAMGYANKAAAVAVSKRGVVAVEQSEIKL